MIKDSKELYAIIKDYLAEPWGKINKDKEDIIKDFVNFPLRNPEKPGGLSRRGEEWARSNGYQDLIALSTAHKERTRIDIHATLKSAQLYAKGKQTGLDEEEKTALFGGITLGSELEKLQTVKKGGKLLAAGFVDKLGNLHKRLKENDLQGRNRKFIKVIEQAAIAHKKAEKEDKAISEKIAGL